MDTNLSVFIAQGLSYLATKWARVEMKRHCHMLSAIAPSGRSSLIYLLLAPLPKRWDVPDFFIRLDGLAVSWSSAGFGYCGQHERRCAKPTYLIFLLHFTLGVGSLPLLLAQSVSRLRGRGLAFIRLGATDNLRNTLSNSTQSPTYARMVKKCLTMLAVFRVTAVLWGLSGNNLRSASSVPSM